MSAGAYIRRGTPRLSVHFRVVLARGMAGAATRGCAPPGAVPLGPTTPRS